MSDDQQTTALERQRGDAIVRAANGEDIAAAITEYKRVQDVLDQALPDCIMRIQGRAFRKKNYWRAVAIAFNLDVNVASEEVTTLPDGDWGYIVVCQATAPNGRQATGDGACMWSEKASYNQDGTVNQYKTKNNATVHNIRGHAHTRAYNRAVSNLVGFGEVSAEEINRDGHRDDAPPSRQEQEWLEDETKFLAYLESIGIPYNALLAELVRQKRPAPYAMTRNQRRKFLADVRDGRFVIPDHAPKPRPSAEESTNETAASTEPATDDGEPKPYNPDDLPAEEIY